MARVLLTGARTAIALELARHLHAAGHEVIATDPFEDHVTRHSRCVTRSIQVPSPRFERDAFARALRGIIERERVTDLVPTGEESLWVAAIRDQLQRECRVHVGPLASLVAQHDKLAFQRLAAPVGPSLPTVLATDLQAVATLRRAGPIVLKRRYSRFGQGVRRLAPGDPLPKDLDGVLAQPWVAGDELCSLAIARDGVLTAHVAYEPRYRLPLGPSFYFDPLTAPDAEAWCRELARVHHLTGAFAIDFVKDRAGTLWPLECNPRYTSGVHLFPRDGRLATAVLGESVTAVLGESVTAVLGESVTAVLGQRAAAPTAGGPAMWASAMLAVALPRVRHLAELRRWRHDVARARDVLWDKADPSPTFHAFASRRELAALRRRHGLTLSQATTWLTEWNDGPVDPPSPRPVPRAS